MTDVCEKCIHLKAELIRSEEARLRDKVAFKVSLASSKHSVKETATEDLIARILDMGEWKEDKAGRLVLHKGGLAALSTTGYEITPEVAVRDLAPVAPHLYDREEDTNADISNPWAKGPGWNMTKQGELFLQNPSMAKKLAAAAGITIKD